MPSEHEHLWQHQENTALRAHLRVGGGPPSGVVPQWEIALLFYAAVHWVEGRLARHGVHPRSHPDRRSLIAVYWPGANQGALAYQDLHALSMRARYSVWRPSPADVAQADADLNDVLAHLV